MKLKNIMQRGKYFSILISSFSIGMAMLSSCDDLIDPAKENFKDVDQMYEDAAYAQGFLVNAYRSIPSYYDNSEYATDDAVTNEKDNAFLKMATGSWTAQNNPMNYWQSCLGAIQYLNLFLENCDRVHWAEDPEAAALFNLRMKGEAYGLRGLFFYYLLRNHSGYSTDGDLLGIPMLTKFMEANSNFNTPRDPFKACIAQVYADLDSAITLLPEEYEDISNISEVPARMKGITSKVDTYNRVNGHYARQLMNGLIAKAFKSRVALLAASPAYAEGSGISWNQAADAAAAVIDHINGIAGMDSKGLTYYCNVAEIENLKEGINPKEIIWRQNLQTNNDDQEAANFPPTLFGNGRMNPTQNLVDAFPMANGYPISDARSGYDELTPYADRDPRLAMYIIYDGAKAGVSNTVISTGSKSGTDDGINVKSTSTRTGYYMKKRLRMDVNCDPTSSTKKNHYLPRLRYTEFFLNYAEAANEAYGPTGAGSHGYTAYDVIKAIRERAGICAGADDPYLTECAADKAKMRQLIRNERRLELCFESFRFWDLRRWKANLNETAKGYDASAEGNPVISVETREYGDYMFYGPIPYGEILKYDELRQNKGWE